MQTAQLSLNTLLAVLEANEQGELIKLALMQDLGLNKLEKEVGDYIIVETYKREVESLLKENEEFEGSGGYVFVKALIISVNPLSLTKSYKVELPTGATKWLPKDYNRHQDHVTRIIDKTTKTVAVGN